MTIFALVLVGLFGGADAHAENCRCGQANVVCRKHQWMIMAMFAILLTYIWMYGETLFMRYFGTCYRWFQEKFGSAKPAVAFHSCGCGCEHHEHEHKHADSDESDCGGCDHCDHTHEDSENKKEL